MRHVPQVPPPSSPLSQSEVNLLLSALSGNPSPPSPVPQSNTANRSYTNQMLNLQAALLSMDPNTLAGLLSTLNSVQPSPMPPMVKNPNGPISQLQQNPSSNTGALAKIVELLSMPEISNCPKLVESIQSTFTALAAALDSNKSLQVNGYHGRPMAPSSPAQNYLARSLRHSPTFSHQSPSISPFNRRPLSEAALAGGPFNRSMSTFEGDIDRAATIYRNSASELTLFNS